MSGLGAPRLDPPAIPARGIRVALIAARWHEHLIDGLLDGAHRALDGATVQLIRVPGAFELPVAAARVADEDTAAIVALGVVLRGDTPHFDYVCQAATMGLMTVSVERGLPVGLGLLTCDTHAQAVARIGGPGSIEDKGFDAAQAALRLAIDLAPWPRSR
ncbi:MAG: 6,7-dimethyl-8-ribityllumazine synthase [Angustibacter sp.]